MRRALILMIAVAGCAQAPGPALNVSPADAWACEAQAQQAAAAGWAGGMLASIIHEQNARTACLMAAHHRNLAGGVDAQAVSDAELRAQWCAALRRQGQQPRPGECGPATIPAGMDAATRAELCAVARRRGLDPMPTYC